MLRLLGFNEGFRVGNRLEMNGPTTRICGCRMVNEAFPRSPDAAGLPQRFAQRHGASHR
jgi:hypothetical protein